ncbi:MAG TPA: di-heme oxidoredictase family protein [Candidatus Aquilonibacter sp.]|jgi:hypothetical protein|nr:di-heme oxidoredictase family protein [Candidatus Aquilonibacter sp.]
MRGFVTRGLRLPATFLLLSSLTFLVSPPKMHSQAAINPNIFDPGPRNPGNQNAPFCPTQNVGVTPKFPNNNMGHGAPPGDCVDIIQPPSAPGQETPAAAGAGNIVGGIYPPSPQNTAGGLWLPGLDVFSTVASVSGPFASPPVSGEPMVGLGPSFNAQSCLQCHMVPAVGGTSPGTVTIQTSPTTATIFAMPIATTPPPLSAANPQIADATDDGGTNGIPNFPPAFAAPGASTPGFSTVQADGPAIEVRFVQALAASGASAGVGANGVGNLFTIQGRGDLPAGCVISQINFAALPSGSISFRIPTPTYGLGFVESTPDPILIQNSVQSTTGNTLGVIGGVFNTSGNDGTITRFGWKAQNKSLLIFAGEAENVEMGVTNELFPNERTWGATPAVVGGASPVLTVPPCINNAGSPSGQGYPEDEVLGTGTVLLSSSNAEEESIFMLLNGAPSQCSSAGAGTYGSPSPACVVFNSNETTGQSLFGAAGCTLCHSPTLTTGPSPNVSLSSANYHPYSDFALHFMGGLDDGITQGAATGSQFRTAPLWGLGQRLFFMHDGRATDLINAIADHCIATSSVIHPSEACGSVGVFNGLSNTQQQQILDFLRSL